MSVLNLPTMSNSGSTQRAADGSQHVNDDNITDITNIVADVPVGAEAS